jgi:uncharacterized protein (TIGR03435 family)
MCVFCQTVVCFLVALPAVAQSQAFATITIEPARSADPRNARVQVLPNGDLIASAVPVITLLSYAYDVPVNPSPRLSPLPDWTLREKYDIEAKAPANAIPPSLQDSEVRSRIQQMIRGLLADRFRLVMRVENKTMSAYALTVASGGPKLQKSAIAEKDCTFDTGPDACHNFVGGLGHPLNAKAIDMDDLVHYIGNWTDLPVVNRTALSGLFTVNTEGWVPMRLPPPPPNATPAVKRGKSYIQGRLDVDLLIDCQGQVFEGLFGCNHCFSLRFGEFKSGEPWRTIASARSFTRFNWCCQ